ncbi:NADH dehydrogenase [ubiquinone] 1 beta subcomplex subunit 2, mitochondrial [Hemibagrus wyckioides]|nr:NADH dehydrogenase [ubiquinone] 1 beta subcomplex subunit 2, mitochondrial [Hemibagrus wyckioides]
MRSACDSKQRARTEGDILLTVRFLCVFVKMSALGRTVSVLRAGVQLVRRGPQHSFIRKAGDSHIVAQYRQLPQLTKRQKFRSELLSGFMWFWILWHCWHDSDAVLGHFPWPDTDAWTDEELGIPPDDE